MVVSDTTIPKHLINAKYLWIYANGSHLYHNKQTQ